jgi:hypothetical protein
MRVFVSSTFLDMQAEREELMKRVFPALRARCEARGVTWGEVDLRWGITRAEAHEGQVLPICLAEIDGCRPFFIGLLGDRYGWVPDAIEDRLTEDYPWLSDLLGRSVTEMEFYYGAMSAPSSRPFFYLRDPSRLDTLPPGDRARYESADAVSRARLAALKERLRAAFPDRVRVYTTPRHLAELVECDLTGLIETLYPPEPDSPVEQDALAQEVFLNRLAALHRGRAAELGRLEAHAQSDRGPACLVVAGEPGVGKSSLLAAWVTSRRGEIASAGSGGRSGGFARRLARALGLASGPAAGTFLLSHFAGVTPGGVDLAPVLQRLVDRLGARFGFHQEIPAGVTGPAAGFANALARAAASARVLVVIDGLDHLDPRRQGVSLAWLPEEWPRGVRVVVSASPGPVLNELMRRGGPILTIGPLPADLRAGLVRDYLQGRYRRRLDDEEVRAVASHPSASNGYFLRTVLDELVASVRRIEDLPERVEQIRGEADAAGVYGRILERLEREEESGRPGLIGEALSLLYAARHGLSDGELRDLLGEAGRPLPAARWSPVAMQLRPHARARPGLIGPGAPPLRQAVERDYLRDPAALAAAHRRLADYFGGRPASPRVVEERPCHLAALGDWTTLAAAMADAEFLRVAWPRHKNELKSYWSAIEERTPLRLPVLLAPLVADPSASPEAAWAAAHLLAETGHREEALRLARWGAVREGRGRADALDLAAAISMERGDWPGALAMAEGLADEAARRGDEEARINGLLRAAAARRRLGARDRAIAAIDEAERLAGRLAPDRLADVLGQRALLLDEGGKFSDALSLCRRRANLYGQAGDLGGLAASLDHQGRLLARMKRSKAALAAFAKEEAIARRLLDRAALQNCLGNTAELLIARRRLGEVPARLDEREALCRALGDPRGLALTYLQKADYFGTTLKQPRLGRDFAERAMGLAAAHELDDIIEAVRVVQDRFRRAVRG